MTIAKGAHQAIPVARGPAIAVTNESRAGFRGAQWWSPTSGVRLPDDRRELTDVCDAVLVAVPAAVFSGATAAKLWQVPIPIAMTKSIEISVPDAHIEIRRPGLRCRRRDIPSASITVLNGRPILTPARLFVDFGRELQLEWLVAFGDAALRAGLLCQPEIVRALAECTGHRGIVRARQALRLLDARAESPRESITRVILKQAGIDALEPQHEVFDENGVFVARVDLAVVDSRIAVEYDGVHHLTPEQQAKDAIRRQRLAMLGWLEVTLNSQDIHQPERLISRVRTALDRRALLHVRGFASKPVREVALGSMALEGVRPTNADV